MRVVENSLELDLKWLDVVVRLTIERLDRLGRRIHMRTDVSRIKFEGDKVILPLEVYIELKSFARMHGESDLPDPLVAKLVEASPAPTPLAHVLPQKLSAKPK